MTQSARIVALCGLSPIESIRVELTCWARRTNHPAETVRDMVKSQPEKLDTLIKAWLDEAVRGEVIPAGDRGRIEIVGHVGRPWRRDRDKVAGREMAAD